ncbi:MAG: hypothetical protein ACRENG_33915, partial [bacterium]
STFTLRFSLQEPTPVFRQVETWSPSSSIKIQESFPNGKTFYSWVHQSVGGHKKFGIFSEFCCAMA